MTGRKALLQTLSAPRQLQRASPALSRDTNTTPLRASAPFGMRGLRTSAGQGEPNMESTVVRKKMDDMNDSSRTTWLGTQVARWSRQWHDVVRVDTFPTHDWALCATILAFLGFTELAVIGPMRKELENKEMVAAARALEQSSTAVSTSP